MATIIDERAVIGRNVDFGDNVSVAPFVVIEDNVRIGSGTTIGSHSYIGSNTTIGDDCCIFNGVSLGTIAQDLKYRDEDASLSIGDRAIIREFVTMNKGTSANNGVTKIGDDCALLAYCHIGHDCEVGNHFVASNELAMAGHVVVGDHVTCGGKVAFHQFCRVGDNSFIGAGAIVLMDVIPYALVALADSRAYVAGLNKVGLERRGFSVEDISQIKTAYKILFRKGYTLDQAQKYLATEIPNESIRKTLLSFTEITANTHGRGLLRMKA